MRTSLIVTTYNSPIALEMVLKSIEIQTINPYEVIIADDGSSVETKIFLTEFAKKSKLNLIHSWQKDHGFRAAKSRNRAIAKSQGEYIILIDGDAILHKDFIQDHLRFSKPKLFLQGGRVLMTKDKTIAVLADKKIYFSFFSSGILNRKNAVYSNFLARIFSIKSNCIEGIKTCNMSFYRQDCININGFNHDFEGWGREDSEFVVRLMNNGVERKNIRFNALQFHLWHQENSRKYLVNNNLLLRNSISKNSSWCKNGISQFINK